MTKVGIVRVVLAVVLIDVLWLVTALIASWHADGNANGATVNDLAAEFLFVWDRLHEPTYGWATRLLIEPEVHDGRDLLCDEYGSMSCLSQSPPWLAPLFYAFCVLQTAVLAGLLGIGLHLLRVFRLRE